MVLAARPGHRATVLVALAGTAGTRVKSRAGKDTKVPPPARAFSVPAIAAAKNRRMAWLRCKPTVYQKYGAPEKDAVWRTDGDRAENSTAERSSTRNRSSLVRCSVNGGRARWNSA